MLKIHVSIRKVMQFLLATNVFLVVMYALTQYLRVSHGHNRTAWYSRLWDMDGEQSIPAIVSMLQMLSAALSLFVIGASARVRQQKWAWHWIGLSAVFVFLAFDEAVSIHEIMTKSMRDLFRTKGILMLAWVIPYTAATLSLGIVYLKFFRHLPRRIATGIIAAGIIFVTGAVGMEMIAGPIIKAHGLDYPPYILLAGIEETLENAGIVLFLITLLCHIRDQKIVVGLHIPRPGETDHGSHLQLTARNAA